MSKTIIVSNRLPVKISKNDDELVLVPSEGGLATGLGSIYKQGDNIWIGWPGVEIIEGEKNIVTNKLAEYNLLPVFLSQEEINEYYEGFSNDVLWPVFHYYAFTNANYKESNWDYYKDVNQKFTDTILKVLEPGDIIWVHDYQLLLVPALVRVEFPDVTIGFFQHIPFPSNEMFRLIPWRDELLTGMLGADLIGFHTFDDVRYFINAATRLLPASSSSNVITYDERSVVVEAFPMGIDFNKYASLPLDEVVKEQAESISETFRNCKLVISIDRLDYSKGILQRLQAFELLLQRYPEWHGRISLYMVIVPSRDSVPQYAELRETIDKRAGNINSLYRTMDWIPLHYYYRSVPIELLSALYSTADVCLVTPIRDGMNLVSKEFVASRINDDGVLILSEMAGASKELIDAIIVNPNNIVEICESIITALNMPLAEQHQRMHAMRQIGSKFNIEHWVKVFMEKLQEVKQMQRSLQTRRVIGVTEQSIIKRYQNTNKRLIFLDYDGTLVGFKQEIEQASPDKDLYTLIDSLTSDPKNLVVLISGRKYQNLEKWFGNYGLHLIAEHGTWFKEKDGEWQRVSGLSDSWKQEIYPRMETYIDRTPGSFIEEKTYSLVWHYRKSQKGLGELRAGELMNNLRYFAADKGLQLLQGDKVLEVKNIEINKGKAALTLLEKDDFDFIIAFGDDYTDEDLFKALPDNAVTIKVGSNISAAKFYIRNPQEVRKFLASLNNDIF